MAHHSLLTFISRALGQAPAAAEALSDIILLGKSVSLDLAFFDPARFVGARSELEEEANLSTRVEEADLSTRVLEEEPGGPEGPLTL